MCVLVRVLVCSIIIRGFSVFLVCDLVCDINIRGLRVRFGVCFGVQY